jgi:hypothetical protein
MTNLLQDGAAWLGGQLKDHAGTSITYQRGVSTVTITATATLHEYEVVDQEGFSTTVLSRDYLVHAADLVLGGAEIAPRSGDLIAETIGGVACTFEVMPLGMKKEYEPVDRDGLLLRIHTKKVA